MTTTTQTCSHTKAERRDEALCGTCYGEALLREPMPTMRQAPALELVYSPDQHMMITRKVKGPR